MNDDLTKEMQKAFVRGEVSALVWVSTIRSLTPNERAHIKNRLDVLNAFLRGERLADFSGTDPKFVPDFYKGDEDKP